MKTPRQELHTLSAFVHGALVTLHTLGAVYNARKKNAWETVAHTAGIAFSLYGTIHHLQESHYEHDKART